MYIGMEASVFLSKIIRSACIFINLMAETMHIEMVLPPSRFHSAHKPYTKTFSVAGTSTSRRQLLFQEKKEFFKKVLKEMYLKK